MGEEELVKLLLEKGADVIIRDRDGITMCGAFLGQRDDETRVYHEL